MCCPAASVLVLSVSEALRIPRIVPTTCRGRALALARACGKDRQAIEKLENGKVNPTLYSLYEIAKALEVSLSAVIDLKV